MFSEVDNLDLSVRRYTTISWILYVENFSIMKTHAIYIGYSLCTEFSIGLVSTALRQISTLVIEVAPSREEITGDVRAQVGRMTKAAAIVGGVALDSVYQLLHRTRLVARETNTPGQIVNLCFLVITPAWS